MKRFAFVFACTALMVACATDYQDSGFTGGFSETLLSENVVKIHFRGNAYTSAERTSDFTLLRAAEFSLERGYSHFVILETNDWVKTSTQTTGGSTKTESSYNFETQKYEKHSVATSPKTVTTHKPRSELTIMMFGSKPDTEGLIFDANFIRESIRTKYEFQDQ